MSLAQRWHEIAGNRLVRSVGLLAGGTAFAQALMLLALPLLTRLYTPDDFSLLAIYSSIVGTIFVAAGLRFDIAIPLAEEEEDALGLLALALLFSTLSAVLALVVFMLGREQIASWLGRGTLGGLEWFIPAGIFCASTYNAMQMWATRRKAFGLIARTRLTQSVSAVSVQAGVGWWSGSPLGLMAGQLLNHGAGSLLLARGLVADCRRERLSPSVTNMRAMFVRYQRFPKFSTFEALANNAALQLPVLLIAAIVAGPEAGFLVLAMQVMQAPVALISSAVGQVYLAHAAKEEREGRLAAYTADTLAMLTKVGVGPLCFAGIVAPVAFPFVFGAAWERSGVLVAWLTPSFLLQFLTSPLSMSLHVLQKQREALMLQVAGLVIRIGLVVGAWHAMGGYIPETYAVSGGVFYALYLVVILRCVRLSATDLGRLLGKLSVPVCAWIVAGVVVNGVMRWAVG
ncbi:O-antigen flippase Wzx [plant metagenome]|uniref:O-antigen flippase Wzx n=2 Tax=root TaxID=1 RepID=A0A1C3K088_9BURK|nr:oligosaccharide flippase family protein [Orrella dioscoreae]SBT24825.1 O-antigen flippase Wzx [Orrella dioscoreae]SOE50590.1 O-antigen flippase Wzx [Orrella dioscoreae]